MELLLAALTILVSLVLASHQKRPEQPQREAVPIRIQKNQRR
ncbi:hypothetical protein Dxin01_02041 [Deinococcus xinjiangensis]|uniref:Uncharacterized protein n=1 Tax=Deinococcus xinjiangensis TaxID=457454 RepID=A0ABP9VF03_9DEIO